MAGSLITMGTLGDRIGRRRLLLIGAGAFAVASVVAAFSNSPGMLIATRALLGLAGATIAPSTLSLIRNMFLDPQQRTMAIGVWITSYSVGGAIGPLVGGVLLEYFWWGSVFLISVPVMALLLILGPMLLPEYRDPNAGRLDLLSAALSLAAVLAMIFGLKQIAQDGVSADAGAVHRAPGVVIGLVFVRRQLRWPIRCWTCACSGCRRSAPRWRRTAWRSCSCSAASCSCPSTCSWCKGMSPFAVGAVDAALGAGVRRRLDGDAAGWSQRFRPAYVMAVGTGVRRHRLRDVHAPRRVHRVLDVRARHHDLLAGHGAGVHADHRSDRRVGAARARRRRRRPSPRRAPSSAARWASPSSAASAWRCTAPAWWARSPTAFPRKRSESARATLGGAVEVAGKLPGQTGPELAETAQAAFIRGVQFCAAISAGGSLLLAAFAALTLRHSRGGAEPVPEGPAQATATSAA